MEKTMIQVSTGEFYRVPEDMFPGAAGNLVDCGRAKWVPRKKPSMLQGLKIQTASMIGNARTAAMRFIPDAGRAPVK